MLREATLGDMPLELIYLGVFSAVAMTAAALRFLEDAWTSKRHCEEAKPTKQPARFASLLSLTSNFAGLCS